MKKISDIKDKLDVLDPDFKKNMQKILNDVHTSLSVLYDAATKDRKTGTYNYDFFESTFKMEIAKAKRGFQKLSLLIIDIDYFKKINDTYGHVKADEMLKQLGQILIKQTRRSDIVARFGGEEFVILLPETNMKKAKEVSLRIKKAIRKDKFLRKYKLTISGGLTEYILRDTMKKMLARADKVLYYAKETGRDKLVAVQGGKMVGFGV